MLKCLKIFAVAAVVILGTVGLGLAIDKFF